MSRPLIGSAVFGFSAYSFGSVSGALTGRVEQESSAAADRTLEPEKAADYMEGIARANAVTHTVGQQGRGAFQGSRTMEESQRVARAQGMASGRGNYGEIAQRTGRVEGAETRGRIEGVAAVANKLGKEIQETQQGISETELLQRHAGSGVSQEINQQIAAGNPGNSVQENWHQQSLLAGAAQTKALGEASGWNSDQLQDVLTTQAQGNFAITEAQQQVAENLGKTYPELQWDFANMNERLLTGGLAAGAGGGTGSAWRMELPLRP